MPEYSRGEFPANIHGKSHEVGWRPSYGLTTTGICGMLARSGRELVCSAPQTARHSCAGVPRAAHHRPRKERRAPRGARTSARVAPTRRMPGRRGWASGSILAPPRGGSCTWIPRGLRNGIRPDAFDRRDGRPTAPAEHGATSVRSHRLRLFQRRASDRRTLQESTTPCQNQRQRLRTCRFPALPCGRPCAFRFVSASSRPPADSARPR